MHLKENLKEGEGEKEEGGGMERRKREGKR